MRILNDFGVLPTRGTEKSVGLDFYLPFIKFGESETDIKSKIESLEHYLQDVKKEIWIELKEWKQKSMYYQLMSDAEYFNLVILYISLQPKFTFLDKLKGLFDLHKYAFDRFINRSIKYDKKTPVLKVKPGECVCVPSGIHTKFKKGFYGDFENKSGMGLKGWQVGAKVIDEDYSGIIHVNLRNTSKNILYLTPGQKLSQLIEKQSYISKVTEMTPETYYDSFEDSERGSGGFGSTGK
jgi:dUTP pyrophosphatase